MYDTILVPIDGSETSKHGLAEAIKLAKKLGSQLHLLHIVNEFILDYTYSSSARADDLIASIREQGRALLAAATSEARRHNLDPKPILVETIGGPAAELIVEKAKEIHADLIVMGTHGRRGLRRLALGSDAEEVLRLSTVPVLLVRGPLPSKKAHAERHADAMASQAR